MPIGVPDIFDFCVIGCGPGGFAAAVSALDAGKHVCIIEGGEIGGTGVMWGALTSKTMWELAKDYAIAAKIDRGYRSSGLLVDYQAVRTTVIQAAKEKQYQMLSQIETYSPQRWKGPGSLTIKRGWGSFLSRDALSIRYSDSAEERIRARYFLISTGSTPKQFSHIGVDQKRILDSDGILKLKEFPKRLMIIGAGVIGCEYATIFSNFGQTKVYLVDHMDRIIPYEDEDISDYVHVNLMKNDVEIYHSAMLRDIIKQPDYLEVVLDFADGHAEVVEVDAALIAIGRSPNYAGLNLDSIGIVPNEKNCLETDQNCCLKENIYAAGDVTHYPNLLNMAEMEGRFAANHIFGANRWPLTYNNLSTVMFFYPPVAAVGLNEKTCQQKKIPYRVGYYSNALVSRAIAMRRVYGFVKIIISDDAHERILGMRAAGPQVSSTIMPITLLMEEGRSIEDVLRLAHPHPTISEGIQECLRMLLGKSIFKPHAFPRHIKIRRWHPDRGYLE